MKTITLTISEKYVLEWGLWEAMRELIQNAYDQRDSDPTCEATVEYRGDMDGVRITTTTGRLTIQSLLLGQTTKVDAENQRGVFGEGYKLALLVLTRLGYDVRIYNQDEIWKPVLEDDPMFECKVLKIQISDGEFRQPGVSIFVGGISYIDYREHIAANLADSANRILRESDQKGRVYSGGLFVGHFDNFEYGYCFLPKILPLDRDRKMVGTYNLALAVAKLWGPRNDPEIYSLLKSSSVDLHYFAHPYISDITAESPSVKLTLERYTKEFGEALPVTNQTDIKMAEKVGMKWALVTDKLKAVLMMVKSWVLPEKPSPLKRLKALRLKIEDESLWQELDSIIEDMEQNG